MEVQKAGCQMVRFRTGVQQRHTFCTPPINGVGSIIGNAPGCDPGKCGFESRPSPQTMHR